MTRINLVHPTQLTNKHLMAEYRELPRIFTSVAKLEGKKPTDVNIPPRYVLGTGHMKFFYNKLSWLLARYEELYDELIKRGYNIDTQLFLSVVQSTDSIPRVWFNSTDYNPSPEDVYLNMVRICKRSNIATVDQELSCT